MSRNIGIAFLGTLLQNLMKWEPKLLITIKSVYRNFLQDYENGLTPNPDILCNRYIKFDAFHQYCTKNLHADAIATGHYARTSFGSYLQDYVPNKSLKKSYISSGILIFSMVYLLDVKLLRATDTFKDQTFFLSQIPQLALRQTMFPLGDLLKNDVKLIAKTGGLDRIARKRESTGICFVGKRNFTEFISDVSVNHLIRRIRRN